MALSDAETQKLSADFARALQEQRDADAIQVAVTLLSSGRPKEALEAFQTIGAQFPARRALAAMNSGAACFGLERYDDAIRYYEEAGKLGVDSQAVKENIEEARTALRARGGVQSDPQPVASSANPGMGAPAGGAPRVFYAEQTQTMEAAYHNARSTFGYFWREMHWERRRIVKACDIAHAKAAFWDYNPNEGVEHLWMEGIEFDGQMFSGTIINQPNYLRSVQRGQRVSLPPGRLTDWMYVIGGQVCGGFTVNLMRSQMSPEERASHDGAWGLDFGDPAQIQLTPTGSGWSASGGEHPMAVNMAPKLAEQLQSGGLRVGETDAVGWTLLHHEALAGSTPTLQVLLQFGANRAQRTRHGMTAFDLAMSLGWSSAAAMLRV